LLKYFKEKQKGFIFFISLSSTYNNPANDFNFRLSWKMSKQYEIKNKFYFPLSIRVFSGLVMAVLISAVMYGSLKVLVIYPVGFYLILCKGGTEIDFEKGRIRDYQLIITYKIGDWEKLPKLSYIAFHRITELFGVRGSRAGNFDTHTEQKYKVNLVSDKNEIILLFISDHHTPAFQVAKEVSKISGLNVFVTDGKGKPHWIYC
jgi:hypothetical protein